MNKLVENIALWTLFGMLYAILVLFGLLLLVATFKTLVGIL